jgi:hypothetical protein
MRNRIMNHTWINADQKPIDRYVPSATPQFCSFPYYVAAEAATCAAEKQYDSTIAIAFVCFPRVVILIVLTILLYPAMRHALDAVIVGVQ